MIRCKFDESRTGAGVLCSVVGLRSQAVRGVAAAAGVASDVTPEEALQLASGCNHENQDCQQKQRSLGTARLPILGTWMG